MCFFSVAFCLMHQLLGYQNVLDGGGGSGVVIQAWRGLLGSWLEGYGVAKYRATSLSLQQCLPKEMMATTPYTLFVQHLTLTGDNFHSISFFFSVHKCNPTITCMSLSLFFVEIHLKLKCSFQEMMQHFVLFANYNTTQHGNQPICLLMLSTLAKTGTILWQVMLTT